MSKQRTIWVNLVDSEMMLTAEELKQLLADIEAAKAGSPEEMYRLLADLQTRGRVGKSAVH